MVVVVAAAAAVIMRAHIGAVAAPARAASCLRVCAGSSRSLAQKKAVPKLDTPTKTGLKFLSPGSNGKKFFKPRRKWPNFQYKLGGAYIYKLRQI